MIYIPDILQTRIGSEMSRNDNSVILVTGADSKDTSVEIVESFVERILYNLSKKRKFHVYAAASTSVTSFRNDYEDILRDVAFQAGLFFANYPKKHPGYDLGRARLRVFGGVGLDSYGRVSGNFSDIWVDNMSNCDDRFLHQFYCQLGYNWSKMLVTESSDEIPSWLQHSIIAGRYTRIAAKDIGTEDESAL